MPKTVILSAARTPIGKLSVDRDEARGIVHTALSSLQRRYWRDR